MVSRVNDWVGAELLLLYEEESDNDGDLNIDTALITLADLGANWFVKAGRGTLPFGVYPTYMLSDPLTLELGETNDSAVEAGYAVEGLNFSLFLFQGDHSDKVDDLGAQFGYQARREGFAYSFNLSYLNNLAESNGIVDGGWISGNDKRPGWAVSLEFGLGPWNLVGEYLAASEGFADAGGDEPAAYNLEVAYAFERVGRPWTLAVGCQATDDAASAQWGLPEKRLLGSLSLELVRQTRIGVEYRRDRDYTGDRSDTLTAQLAVTF